jgi:hypothetical protein
VNGKKERRKKKENFVWLDTKIFYPRATLI